MHKKVQMDKLEVQKMAQRGKQGGRLEGRQGLQIRNKSEMGQARGSLLSGKLVDPKRKEAEGARRRKSASGESSRRHYDRDLAGKSSFDEVLPLALRPQQSGRCLVVA